MSIQLETMSMDLDKPFAIKVDKMEFKSFTLLLGQNGSGKSFILKQSFALGFIAATYIKAINLNMSVPNLKDLANFVVSNTFVKPDFNGSVSADYTGGISVFYEIKEGIVTEAGITGTLSNVDFPFTRFLSSEMRTFDDINKYLRTRSRLTGSDNKLTDESYAVLLQDYRLYDLVYIEELIGKSPITIKGSLVKDLDKEVNPISIEVDFAESDFLLTLKNGEKKYCTTYGKGHQSLINMGLIGYV